MIDGEKGRLLEDEYDDSTLIVAKKVVIVDKDDKEKSLHYIAELNGAVFDPRSGNYSTSARKFWTDFKFRKVKESVFTKYINYLGDRKSAQYAEIARGYLND